FNAIATPARYTLSLHDALPICELSLPIAWRRIGKCFIPSPKGRRPITDGIQDSSRRTKSAYLWIKSNTHQRTCENSGQSPWTNHAYSPPPLRTTFDCFLDRNGARSGGK